MKERLGKNEEDQVHDGLNEDSSSFRNGEDDVHVCFSQSSEGLFYSAELRVEGLLLGGRSTAGGARAGGEKESSEELLAWLGGRRWSFSVEGDEDLRAFRDVLESDESLERERDWERRGGKGERT